MSELISTRFHTLVTQPTTLCNLNCGYCYLPDRKRQRLMSVEVAAALAASVAEQASPRPVEVVWHCGEPLATPIGHMRALLAEFEPLRRDGAITHGVQTNATLINDAWCELFAEYGFAVGVSIDGPAACNAARVDWAGRASYRRIMHGVERLGEAGISFTAICVVTPDTIGRAADLVRFFTDIGCASVGFNIEEKEGVNLTGLTLAATDLRGADLRGNDLTAIAGVTNIRGPPSTIINCQASQRHLRAIWN